MIGLDRLRGPDLSKGVDLWRDFKSFALKGNIVDLAVAVIIGNAFGAVVNSLVKNVIMPMISYVTSWVTPSGVNYRSWKLGPIEIGVFLGELVNFLVIAGVLYLVMVRLLRALRLASLLPTPEPMTRLCPLCQTDIPIKARKCPHCTADLPAPG